MTHLTPNEQGNAADALVATELCVGVTGMYHSGIGGGGFMLVRDENGRYETIDYRESAPAAAHRDMYKDNPQASVTGALSVAVPGELRGLEYLHKNYGVSDLIREKFLWFSKLTNSLGTAMEDPRQTFCPARSGRLQRLALKHISTSFC